MIAVVAFRQYVLTLPDRGDPHPKRSLALLRRTHAPTRQIPVVCLFKIVIENVNIRFVNYYHVVRVAFENYDHLVMILRAALE